MSVSSIFLRIQSKNFSSLVFFKSNNKDLSSYSCGSKSNVLLKTAFEFFFTIRFSINFFLSRGCLGVWINFSASIFTVCDFCGFFRGTLFYFFHFQLQQYPHNYYFSVLLIFLLVYFPDIHPLFLLHVANNFLWFSIVFSYLPFKLVFNFCFFHYFILCWHIKHFSSVLTNFSSVLSLSYRYFLHKQQRLFYQQHPLWIFYLFLTRFLGWNYLCHQ